MAVDGDVVNELLTWVGIEEQTIDPSSARRLAGGLGLDPVAEDEFVDELAKLADWDGATAPHGEFEFRVGNWQVDLAREGIRAALMSTVLAAAIVTTDAIGMGVAILAAVLPSVVEIESVELSAKDDRLLIDVRRVPEVSEGLQTVEALYDALPDDVREVVNRYDFADFVERLRNAGIADTDGDGSHVRIRSADERVPIIQWH